jgi:hypothetical protein
MIWHRFDSEQRVAAYNAARDRFPVSVLAAVFGFTPVSRVEEDSQIPG